MTACHEQSRLQPMSELAQSTTGGTLEWSLHRKLRWRGASWAVLAGALLLAFYGGTLALANSRTHAVEEFLRLWFWVTPLVLGFSLQVGLFAYARGASRAGRAPAHAHGVVASGGATTASMIACCAHHLTDVLPVIGLAGAATLLATYQDVFLLAGVLSNTVGIIYVLGLLRKNGLYPGRASLLSLALRWPVERALKPVIGVALVVFVTVLMVSGRASAADLEKGSQVIGVTKESAGSVTVALTPAKLADGRLLVDIAVSTHRVDDLDRSDLKKLIVLLADGKSIAPSSAPALRGHHNRGQLVFPLETLPSSLVVEIHDLGEPGVRVLRWP